MLKERKYTFSLNQIQRIQINWQKGAKVEQTRARRTRLDYNYVRFSPIKWILALLYSNFKDTLVSNFWFWRQNVLKNAKISQFLGVPILNELVHIGSIQTLFLGILKSLNIVISTALSTVRFQIQKTVFPQKRVKVSKL